MKHVGIFEAKTHLSGLLEEVEKGGEVIITRHGKPIAKLVQCVAQPDPDIVAKRRQAIAEIREMARKRGQRIPIKTIKAWINEGRP
jgi:prevent-host-death family protein